VTTTHTTAPPTAQATTCVLDWCDSTARHNGLCHHHHVLETRAAAYAKRELYAALADYYQDDTTWHDATPPERPTVKLAPPPVPEVWTSPDGTRKGLAALRGMVEDLSLLSGDGRSDALMRMGYRAGCLIAERHLSPEVVQRVIQDCVDALYPNGEHGRRARARRRAMESVADGVRKAAA